MKLLSLSGLATALFFVQDVMAVGSPNGYGTGWHHLSKVVDITYKRAGTTGGAGGVTVTPTTQAELITYLSDSTAVGLFFARPYTPLTVAFVACCDHQQDLRFY